MVKTRSEDRYLGHFDVILGLSWVYLGVILGLSWCYIWIIFGLSLVRLPSVGCFQKKQQFERTQLLTFTGRRRLDKSIQTYSEISAQAPKTSFETGCWPMFLQRQIFKGSTDRRGAVGVCKNVISGPKFDQTLVTILAPCRIPRAQVAAIVRATFE